MKIKRRSHKADIPSMAMGDIAFNLLIFFVILARAHDDSHLQWDPATTKIVEPSGAAKASLLIDMDNKVYLHGQPIGIAQISSEVGEILGETKAGERTVLLKVHKDVPAMFFQPVIEGISEAGGDLVHVLEKQKE
jgi:biopolymer transport protein ExbD